MPPLPDDATLRAYLLGELPEAQAEALEEVYFSDAEALALVRAAEDDLLDDYVAARLSPAQRTAFELRLQSTPTQRERLRAARALRLLADGAPARVASGPRVPFGLSLLALAAVLLLSVFAVRRWWPTDVPVTPPAVARVETPRAVPSPPVTAATAPARVAPITFTIALAPLLTRGQGEAPPVRIPAQVSEVLLEFQGEPGSLPSDLRWRASLMTVEGRELWHGRAEARADPRRAALLAIARLPASLLKPEDYVATLAPEGGSDEAASFRYFLRVVE